MPFVASTYTPVFIPKYIPLSDIAERLGEASFDIAVSVLQVNPTFQVTTKATKDTIDVAHVFVTDDSIKNNVQIAAWKSFAADCQGLPNLDTISPVVVFTDVRTALFQSKVSLTTTFGTQIEMVPIGQFPTTLRNWCHSNSDELLQRRLSIAEVHPQRIQLQTCTLAEALHKDPTTIDDDTIIRVCGMITSFGSNNPRSRVSCAKCSTTYSGFITETSICIACNQLLVCSAKLYLDFTIQEDNNTAEFCAMTKSAGKILEIKALEYHNMEGQVRASFNSKALELLQSKKLSLILVPNATHLAYGEINWELKYIEDN